MTPCDVPPLGGGFITSVASYLDCQAQTLGSGAWDALAAPQSTLTILLTAFLTIFIGVVGYDLLLGRTLTVRRGTLALLKIGVVMALATSWPAYRTLVYEVTVSGPGQFVAEIGPRGGIVGSDGSILQRLDMTDRAMAQLAILGAGAPPPDIQSQVPPPPFGGFDAFALGGSRIAFLITSIGAISAVRIAAGILLALGPIFVLFLLFDATRGLFEGWVRGLAGTFLATVAISIVLGLQLAFIEPWLSSVLSRRLAGEPLPTVPVELFAVILVFSIMATAVLAGCIRVTQAFRLPSWRAPNEAPEPRRVGSPWATNDASISHRIPSGAGQGRSAAIANGLMASDRREVIVAARHAESHSVTRSVPQQRGGEWRPAPVPVGRSFNRRTTSRASGRATRRDAGA